MAEKIGIHDSDVHELKLGRSFSSDSSVAFHSIRYDFKPASVDTSRAANVEIGQGHSVTVEVPHVEGSGTSHTVFKGNKRPCQKECVLIIDHKTGEITLERLTSDLRLKKTRLENSSRVQQQQQRPLTPVDKVKPPTPTKKKAGPSDEKTAKAPKRDLMKEEPKAAAVPAASPVHEMGDSDMSLDDSDSDSGVPPAQESAAAPAMANHPPPYLSTLSEDLQLSDTSGSDSD